MCNPNVITRWEAHDGGSCLSCGAVVPERHALLCTYPGSAGEPGSGLRALLGGGDGWIPPSTSCRGYSPSQVAGRQGPEQQSRESDREGGAATVDVAGYKAANAAVGKKLSSTSSPSISSLSLIHI